MIVNKNVLKTSVKPVAKKGRVNLTLADWLGVFAFMDDHPLLSQEEIVRYFQEKFDGALEFLQSALSRNWKCQQELEERTQSTPMALSSKCVQVVTHPDVERALVLWIQHIEEMGKTYTGDMLQVKRKRFEILLQVPKDQQLSGKGWISPFCTILYHPLRSPCGVDSSGLYVDSTWTEPEVSIRLTDYC